MRTRRSSGSDKYHAQLKNIRWQNNVVHDIRNHGKILQPARIEKLGDLATIEFLQVDPH